ncbi:unnamed protein product, partial [Staurois parvus]
HRVPDGDFPLAPSIQRGTEKGDRFLRCQHEQAALYCSAQHVSLVKNTHST